MDKLFEDVKYKLTDGMFRHFLSPSPYTNVSTSPSRGEVGNNHFFSAFCIPLFNVIRGHRPANLKDYRNKSGNDSSGERDKPENDGGWRRLLSVCCKFFKYPSPEAYASTSPSRGEVLKHVLLPQCAPDATEFLSDVYNRGTRAQKFLADGVQCGRSMIEMLGVLAIIGVLSVGGIAGYSKAMLMWHSNKQKDLLAELINNAIALKPNLSSIRNQTSIEITNIFNALGVIPEGFTYQNNRIYDLDNNSITITYGIDYDTQPDDSKVKVFKYAIRIAAQEGTGKLSTPMKEYCKNIIQVVQTIPNEIQQVDFSSRASDQWNKHSGVLIFNKSTIGQTSPAQINERCNIAIKENGTAYFRILLNPN